MCFEHTISYVMDTSGLGLHKDFCIYMYPEIWGHIWYICFWLSWCYWVNHEVVYPQHHLTKGIHQLPDTWEIFGHQLLVLSAECTSCCPVSPVELPEDVLLPVLQIHQPGVGLQEPPGLHQTLSLQHHASHYKGQGRLYFLRLFLSNLCNNLLLLLGAVRDRHCIFLF